MELEVLDHGLRAPARQALFALGTPRTPIVAHRSWRSTLDKAVAAIEGGKGIVAILGPEGVGKTTLLHELAHIVEQAPRGGITRHVTVLDDAHLLGDSLLGRISEGNDGCVLLAGRPELVLELSMIGPDVAIISMGRIWQGDVPAYLDALCQQTGQTAALIEPIAAERLSVVSSGLPGVLTTVARTAALIAAGTGADRVGPAHVDVAARLFERREALPSSPAALAALLHGVERGTGVSGGTSEPPPVPPDFRRKAVGRQIQSQGITRVALAVAFACALLTAGAVFWLSRGTGPQNNTPAAPRGGAAAPALIETPPPGAAQPSQHAQAVSPPAAAAPAGPPASAAASPPAADAAPTSPPLPPPVAAASRRSRPVSVDVLPPLAPPRVFVSYAAGSMAAKAKAVAVTASLRANGFVTGEPLPSQADPDRPGLGFFFFEDRAAALSVQAAVKQPLGTPGLLALTHGDALPSPGAIDIFIADPHKAVPASRTR